MTTVEIKSTLFREVEELSADALQEVLNFVEYLKSRRRQGKEPSPQQNVSDALRMLEKDSLIHLEEEFAGYKEKYPHE
jgi:hypothetical protein